VPEVLAGKTEQEETERTEKEYRFDS
jgi:hypothetical protein